MIKDVNIIDGPMLWFFFVVSFIELICHTQNHMYVISFGSSKIINGPIVGNKFKQRSVMICLLSIKLSTIFIVVRKRILYLPQQSYLKCQQLFICVA